MKYNSSRGDLKEYALRFRLWRDALWVSLWGPARADNDLITKSAAGM